MQIELPEYSFEKHQPASQGSLVCTRFSVGFPEGSDGRESAYNAGAAGDSGSIPKVRKIPWRRAWQPTPVSLPGESHGQRSLVDYSLWGRKESDTTE